MGKREEKQAALQARLTDRRNRVLALADRLEGVNFEHASGSRYLPEAMRDLPLAYAGQELEVFEAIAADRAALREALDELSLAVAERDDDAVQALGRRADEIRQRFGFR